jgi:hypothetical protein
MLGPIGKPLPGRLRFYLFVYLRIYDLFKDALNTSVYTATNNKMISEK